MTVSFDLTGVDELEAKLRTVQHNLRNKGGRAALRKAANLIARAARKNARALDDPTTRESIARNIAVRWSPATFRRTGDLEFRIGVRGGAMQYGNTRANVRAGRAGQTYATDGGKGNPGGDTWYWRLVEFGTRHSRAKPFLRPAMANNINEAQHVFVTEYSKALDRLTT